MNRREKLLEGVDLGASRGLEIGALCRPMVTARDGAIFYVDHCTTADLRAKYREDPNVDVDAIVEVSYVWGERSLREAVGTGVYFDYVVASHVIEHTPNVVEWLREVAEVLRPGGVCCLAIPDKRFTFDIRRVATDVSVMIDDYLERRRRPSARAIFEHVANAAEVDVADAWAGRVRAADLPRHSSAGAAFDQAARALRERAYQDVHCYAFTPASFAAALRTLMELDLVPLRVRSFRTTAVNDAEFFVQLEKLDPALPASERRRLQLDSLPPPAQTSSADVEAMNDELRQRDALLAAMRGSRSWRVTAPLRALLAAVARLKHGLAGPPRR